MADELGVISDDAGVYRGHRGGRQIGRGLLGQARDGVVALSGGERLQQPPVQGVDQCFLAQVDVTGVLQPVGQGVLLGEAAAVVGVAVGVLALYPAVADGAVDEALEDVWVPNPAPANAASPSTASRRRRGIRGQGARGRLSPDSRHLHWPHSKRPTILRPGLPSGSSAFAGCTQVQKRLPILPWLELLERQR